MREIIVYYIKSVKTRYKDHFINLQRIDIRYFSTRILNILL